MVCEELKERKKNILTDLLNKYGVNKPVDSLIQYESVFLSVEYEKNKEFNELKRAMLYANLKFIVEDGKTVKTNKKEILYSFGKKIIKTLRDYEIDRTISELKLISSLVKQLKLISKIEQEEAEIKSLAL